MNLGSGPTGQVHLYFQFIDDFMELLKAVIPEKAPVDYFLEHSHIFILLPLFLSFLWLAVIL